MRGKKEGVGGCGKDADLVILSPAMPVSSVQLWLGDARLTGANLSSIHTLA